MDTLLKRELAHTGSGVLGRGLSGALLVLAALMVSACGRSAVETPKTPPPRLEPHTRAPTEPRRQQTDDPHIAPPPAYGNKVVLARNDVTPSVRSDSLGRSPLQLPRKLGRLGTPRD